jgi:hypothetical protein
VISDPDPIGGFNRGAGISTTELKIMLLPEISAFTVGTLIKNRTGKMFEIIGEEHGGLKLIPA